MGKELVLAFLKTQRSDARKNFFHLLVTPLFLKRKIRYKIKPMGGEITDRMYKVTLVFFSKADLLINTIRAMRRAIDAKKME